MADEHTPSFILSDDNGTIELLNGVTFKANDHVNIRFMDTDTGNEYTKNIHLEEKCIVQDTAECEGEPHFFAQYIGWGYIPTGLKPDDCITWIQVADQNYHYYGECETNPPAPVEPPPPLANTGAGEVGLLLAASALLGAAGFWLKKKAKGNV